MSRTIDYVHDANDIMITVLHAEKYLLHDVNDTR